MQMCTTPEYFHVSTYFLSFDKTVNGNGGSLIPIAKERMFNVTQNADVRDKDAAIKFK